MEPPDQTRQPHLTRTLSAPERRGSADPEEQRAAVVAEARSWLGTPYHHEADVKDAGIDCAMLLVRVFVDLGLVPAFDPRPYPQHWYLHRGEERYLGFIFDRAREVAEPDCGDVVMWRVGRCFSHGGIVTAWPLVVHAYARARRVIESDVSLEGIFTSEKHPRRFFSYWVGNPFPALPRFTGAGAEGPLPPAGKDWVGVSP